MLEYDSKVGSRSYFSYIISRPCPTFSQLKNNKNHSILDPIMRPSHKFPIPFPFGVSCNFPLNSPSTSKYTCRIIPRLGYSVNNHGDRVSPNWCYSPSKWPKWLVKGVTAHLLTGIILQVLPRKRIWLPWQIIVWFEWNFLVKRSLFRWAMKNKPGCLGYIGGWNTTQLYGD